jgi:hypothetical protein
VAEVPSLDYPVAPAILSYWRQANMQPLCGWPPTWPDGVNLSGFAARKALRLAGVEPDSLRLGYDQRPFPVIGEFVGGQADVLILEAVTPPDWAQATLGSAAWHARPGPARAETPLVAGRATS